MKTVDIREFLKEDGIEDHLSYWLDLPKTLVRCHLKIKTPLVLAGIPYFQAVFCAFDSKFRLDFLYELEGRNFASAESIIFPEAIPFNIAITAERLALNLLTRASAIATETYKLVERAKPFGINVSDTRKTTPGLRALEKYAVLIGGGVNHRFSQTDQWMIKDNHKKAFGGLAKAYDFFLKQRQHYARIIVEIHDLKELSEAMDLGITHVMLDNFSDNDLDQAIAMKTKSMHYEVSGGINLQTIDRYLKPGIDLLSVGRITQFPSSVDLSLKMDIHG